MAEVLTSQDKLHDEAIKLASEIAENAPLASLARVMHGEANRQDVGTKELNNYGLKVSETYRPGRRLSAHRRFRPAR